MPPTKAHPLLEATPEAEAEPVMTLPKCIGCDRAARYVCGYCYKRPLCGKCVWPSQHGCDASRMPRINMQPEMDVAIARVVKLANGPWSARWKRWSSSPGKA